MTKYLVEVSFSDYWIVPHYWSLQEALDTAILHINSGKPRKVVVFQNNPDSRHTYHLVWVKIPVDSTKFGTNSC